MGNRTLGWGVNIKWLAGLVLLGCITAWIVNEGAPNGEGFHHPRLVAAQRSQGLESASSPASSAGERPTKIDRAPVRVLQDPNAAYSAVAVDATRDEIVLQDENRSLIMVYNRLD